MLTFSEKSRCCGCSACAQACPVQCIAMQEDEEGFLYPQIDKAKCVNCGLCEKVCPILNVKPEAAGEPLAFAAYSKNELQRLSSSSGGIFSLLAEQTIRCGGVVFGAEMTEDCQSVHHIPAESIEELKRLRGSKYLQSDIEQTYIQAKQYLDNGRKVLFSGTPCEIEGLKSFLKKDYDNLLCIDLICHGVPSPKLWRKYVRFREKCANAQARQTIFRHKHYGWKSFALLFEFSNNKAYEKVHSKDIYMQMFLQDLCLRPSCYQCQFKKKHRVSDITLADFWGCRNVCPEMDDDKGLSAVLIHSDKGKEAFKSIQSDVVSKQVDIEQVAVGNTALTQSCKQPGLRNDFMNHMDEMSIPELKKRYISRPSIKSELIRRAAAIMPNGIKKLIKSAKESKRDSLH